MLIISYWILLRRQLCILTYSSKLNHLQLFVQCDNALFICSPAKPVAPSHIQLIQAQEQSIKLCWGSVANAEGYLLQIKLYDLPTHDDTDE